MARKSSSGSSVMSQLRPIMAQGKAKLLPLMQGIRPGLKNMVRRPVTGRARPKAGQSVTFLTETGDKRNFWQTTDIGMAQLDEPTTGSVILSFSDQDACLPAAKSLSPRQLNRLTRSELGPNLRVLNEQKSLGMVFATGAERVREHAQPLISGLSLLAHLLKSHKHWLQKDAGPLITGFAFGSDRDRLLVLYLYDGGTLSLLQVTPRTPDTSGAIQNYIKTITKERPALASKGLRHDDPARIVLFESTEIAAVLHTLKPYPTEGDFYGIPQSLVLHFARLSALGVFIAASGWAGTQYLRLEFNQRDKAAQDMRLVAAQRGVSELAKKQPAALIALGSVVPIDRALDKARAVYRAPGRVTVTTGLDQMQLASILDIPAGVSWGMAAGISDQLSAPAPDECTRQVVDTNTSLSQLMVSYVCTQPNSDLAGLFAARR